MSDSQQPSSQLTPEERSSLNTKLYELQLARQHIAASGLPSAELGKGLAECDLEIARIQQSLGTGKPLRKIGKQVGKFVGSETSIFLKDAKKHGRFWWLTSVIAFTFLARHRPHPIRWFRSARAAIKFPNLPHDCFSAHQHISNYRKQRNAGQITQEEAARFALVVCGLPEEYDDKGRILSHPFTVDDHAALFQEAIEAARFSGDRDRIASVFYYACQFSERANRKADFLSFAQQALPFALMGQTPGQRKDGLTDPEARAYLRLMRATVENGKLEEAIELGFKAIPRFDHNHEVLARLFRYINRLKEERGHKKAIAFVQEAAESFITDVDSPATRRRSSLTRHHLAWVHATWRDTPLFDLAKACEYAKEAWKSNPDMACLETASRWYAISETIEAGLGERVHPEFPIQKDYNRVVEEAREEMGRLLAMAHT